VQLVAPSEASHVRNIGGTK